MEKHLKLNEYYENLYDRETVKTCRRIEARPPEIKDYKIGKKKCDMSIFLPFVNKIAIHFSTGERFLNRKRTIDKWMNRDRKRDELLKNSIPPENIYCNKCGESMFVEDRTLYSVVLGEVERVLFIFRCPLKCKRGRAMFDDGEEWIIEPELCDACGFELDKKRTKEGNKILTSYNCSKCSFKKVDEFNLSIKKEKIDKFFNRDRARFCLSEKAGQEYYGEKEDLERLREIVNENKERDKNKELYERVAKLEKLTIVNLEKKLAPILKKSGYIKFELGKPEMGRDVFIDFSTQDEKADREEYESSNNLKKIIKKTLENTNWRLMSEGIHYRLGFLSGRLRGYEKEEDLIKLVK